MNGDEIRDRVFAGAIIATVVLCVLNATGLWEIGWLWATVPVWGLVVAGFLITPLALLYALVSMALGKR